MTGFQTATPQYPGQGLKANSPRPTSGVERLNADLASLGDRLNTCSDRIGMICNQFGAPTVDDPAIPQTAKEIISTNDHMGRLSSIVYSLEKIISRLDNVG